MKFPANFGATHSCSFYACSVSSNDFTNILLCYTIRSYDWKLLFQWILNVFFTPTVDYRL